MKLSLTPGMKTSEFLVAAANLVVQVVLDLNNTQSTSTSVKYSVAGAIAYILSRGLAKYETRNTTTANPTV